MQQPSVTPAWVTIELQGYEAYCSGARQRDCPYAVDTFERFYWECGWFNGLAFELYHLRPWPLDTVMTVH